MSQQGDRDSPNTVTKAGINKWKKNQIFQPIPRVPGEVGKVRVANKIQEEVL